MFILVTPALREHLVKHFGMVEDVSDDDVRALAIDKLDMKTIRQLTAEVTFTEFSTKYITAGMFAVLVEHFGMAKSASKEQAAEFMLACFNRGQIDLKTIREIVKQSPDFLSTDGEQAMTAIANNGGATTSTTPIPSDVLATAAAATKAHTGGGANIRHILASERYSHVKSTGIHKTYKRAVQDERGRDVMTPSEWDHARCAVYLKHRAQKAGIEGVRFSEHEKEIWNEMMLEKEVWIDYDSDDDKTLTGLQVKALLSDSSPLSGGINAVPQVYDETLISRPLLHSELLPLVTLRQLTQGDRVRAASIGNPEVSWGTAEGTSIALFDTADLMAAVDTSIWPVACAIEVGRDFLSDSPSNVGDQLMALAGESLLKELDKVIAVGNGTSQPTGIKNTSNIIGVPVEDVVTDPTVGDLEALAFGLEKQYRTSAMRPCFVGTDEQYQRVRSIAVGSDDQRRVFGLREQSYTIFDDGFSFKISPDFGDYVAFVAMAKYVLYRRQGATSEWTKEGATLQRKNTALLTIRARFGGRMVDSNAAAIWIDEESSSS